MEQSGDFTFEDVLAMNSARIWRISKGYTHSVADAEDLYQEIVIHIWKGLQSYQARSAMSTWIYRIAINTAINYSINKKSTQAHLQLYDDIAIVHPGENENPRATMLYRYISKLNEADRSVITLYLEDFSNGEIAEILGISENYVAVKLSRIRDKLTQYFLNK